MTQAGYRKLTQAEISQLESNFCECQDWARVSVADDFRPDNIRSVIFSGDVRIGVQEKNVELFGGVTRKAGIYNAAIHNCTIGSNVYINKVENYIANYDIADNVIIDHLRMLAIDGPSSFGNGTQISVINEAGGREIPIYDHLSSHVAYMLALYRHRTGLIEKLNAIINKYVESVTSDRGVVGESACILNCGSINAVKIGPYAKLEGASILENGTINSCLDDPAAIGVDVIARDFILSTGAKVLDNSIIAHCFIGQATELAKQYSAENSAFFANCGGYHGEACSIFAGPYTVTHHKATLLIAGMFSFLNAGSGSNQSNHMYKLGPVHQGIVERGSKTTSDSYVLWPARVGAFSLVMGRHYANSDTSDLPFSYLIEKNDESILIPGVNIRSVGTVRDAKKWPKRDKRKDSVKLDHIIFNLLTPYTVQKMINGLELLKSIKNAAGPSTLCYYYNGVKITRASLEKGIDFYNMGIDRYLGNIIVQKIRQNGYTRLDELRSILEVSSKNGRGEWLDLAGLIAPKDCIEKLMCDIETGEISDFESLNAELKSFYDNFLDYELIWVKHVLETRAGKLFEEFTVQDFIDLISNWITAVEKLDNLRVQDARKEFDPKVRIGFGVDGKEDQRDADFLVTRGSAESNDFIITLKEKLQGKKETAAKLIGILEKMNA